MADLDVGMAVKFCEWEPCGKEFTGCRNTQRFCSYSCSNKATQAKRGHVKRPKICRRCGESFIPDTLKRVYCSRACFAPRLPQSSGAIIPRDRICANPECGKSFVDNKKFCSKRCVRYFHAKKRGVNCGPFIGEDTPRSCVNCGVDISHKNMNASYCSVECRLDFTRDVRNAKQRDKGKIQRKDPEFRARRKEYELRTKETRIEYQKAYQKKHIDRYRVLSFKARIKREYGYNLEDLPPRPSRCENPFCKGVKTVFEHNHITGVFRGWVCQRCNSVMGNALDDPAYLRWLADYLEQRGHL